MQSERKDLGYVCGYVWVGGGWWVRGAECIMSEYNIHSSHTCICTLCGCTIFMKAGLLSMPPIFIPPRPGMPAG